MYITWMINSGVGFRFGYKCNFIEKYVGGCAEYTKYKIFSGFSENVF